MSSTNNTRNRLVSILCSVAVVAVSLATVFIAVNSSNKMVLENTLSKNIERAQHEVDYFNKFLQRETIIFNQELYNQAEVLANVLSADSTDKQVEKLAELMELDSVMVTDTQGVCVAAYPAENKGVNIRENNDTKQFTIVLNGFSDRVQSEPVAVDEIGTMCSVSTCVGKPDGSGVVIVSSTEDYSKLLGSEIAYYSNDNTIIAKGDKIISSSFYEKNSSSLKELGITDEKLNAGTFTLNVNDKTYTCMTDTRDEFTVINLIVECYTGINAATIVLILLIMDLIAFGVISVVIIVFDKKNKA